MVRLAISVEGQTEESFVTKVLVPHFQNMGIYVTPILIGKRGGDVSTANAVSDLNRLARSFDMVSTLYDFYGYKGKSPADNCSSLQNTIYESVNDFTRQKLIPYVQQYEFEALLFSSPEAMARRIESNNVEVRGWAETILRQFGGNPEQINDSQQTAPSKRLEAHTNYLKTVNGPDVCVDIGLDEIRNRCLLFDEWISSLEALRN